MIKIFYFFLFSLSFSLIYSQPAYYIKKESLSLNINESNEAFVFYAGGRSYLIEEAVLAELSASIERGNDRENLYLKKYVYEYLDGAAKIKTTEYTRNTGLDEPWQKETETISEYNPLGKIISSLSYSSNEKYGVVQTNKTAYMYDASGRITIKIYSYNKTGKGFTHEFERNTYYEYNSEGNLTRIESNKRDGNKPLEKEDMTLLTYANGFLADSANLFDWIEGGWNSAYLKNYVRNEKGQPLIAIKYYINKSKNIKEMQDSTIYSYDEEGKLIAENRINNKGSYSLNSYTYNQSGSVTKIEVVSGEGSKINSRSAALFKYNSNNLLRSRTNLSLDNKTAELVPWASVEYEYDSAGNCVKAMGLNYRNGQWVPAYARSFINFPGFKNYYMGRSVEVKYKPLK